MRLHFRHEVQRPRARGSQRRRIEPASVIRGDDQAVVRRHPLGSVDTERRRELDRGPDRGAPDGPHGGRCLSPPRLHELRDAMHDVVDGEVGRVEQNRISCRLHVRGVLARGRRRSAANDPPSLASRSRERRRARSFCIRDEKDLHLRPRCDDRPDVAPSITASPTVPSSSCLSRITSRTSG